MLGQPRTTQRRARKVASDEGALRGDIVRLASRFGRGDERRFPGAAQPGHDDHPVPARHRPGVDEDQVTRCGSHPKVQITLEDRG